MPDGQQLQKDPRRDAWHGSGRSAAVAELERTLQREPHSADAWCRLGESYDALARDTADQKTASAYREQAIAALMHAISLSPGLAKAHYALAGVYQTQDPCLALVEFEAAAKCDPETYAAPLVRAQKAIRDCTYRLGDLNIVSASPGQPQPAAAILQAEFYFDDRPVRSAALHSCGSDGTRQTAKFWLFESAEPDFAVDRPVAQVTVSPAGNVFLSRGCPANYQQHMPTPLSLSAPDAVSASAPPHVSASLHAPASPAASVSTRRPVSSPAASPGTQRGRSVLLPVSLMIVVFGGSLFAYLNLIAPVRNAANERVRTEVAAPQAGDAIATRTSESADLAFERSSKETPEPANVAAARASKPAVAMVAAALPRLASAEPVKSQPAAQPFQAQPRTSTPRTEAPSAASAGTDATAAIVAREVALAERAKSIETAIAPATRPGGQLATPPEAPVGAASTLSRSIEVKPLPKEAAPAAGPPQKGAVTALPASNEPLTVVRAAPNEQGRAPRPALKDQPAAAVSPRREPAANDDMWVRQLRGALDACGRPGFLRADVCRETVRWNHCHPNRWGTVRECAVERFASSGSPE